ncbi:hypothetical protein NDA18_004789 [Ustilago nuda]|nr:hypothetical protein NDA18_004789 [Ustilago nuda]
MTRSRVKLDLGPHGKVLASVVNFEDARAVAAARFNVQPSSVQLFVSDGEDLWELHPSAFQEVVAENGVIFAKALLLASSASSPTQASASSSAPISLPAASSSTCTVARAVSKLGSPRADAAIASPSPSQPLIARALNQAGPSNTRVNRHRASSIANSSSTSDTSSSSSSSSSASSSSSTSSHSSSSSHSDRRSESVQDVTATSATVRTIIGPKGHPISSKERWDAKTHRLMFEKLNEIISNERIYYTRKYTEERYRIFQLLIDHYGDMGIKGNFLRGRTAQALISRVSGVLRTARDRGEKIKQPFKFFFPNKKDDEVESRSVTAPVAGGSSGSGASGRLAAATTRTNDERDRAQTLPAQADAVARGRGQGKGKGRVTNGAGGAQDVAPASAQAKNGQGKKKGKNAKGQQNAIAADNANTQGNNSAPAPAPAPATATAANTNPPEIRRRNAAAVALPHASPTSSSRKRPANGAATTAPPQSKKQRSPNKQQQRPPRRLTSNSNGGTSNRGRVQHRTFSPEPSARDAYRSRAAQSRSLSPRPKDAYRRDNNDDERCSQRASRSTDHPATPRRGRGDSWTRADGRAPDDGWDYDDRRWLPPPSSSLPRRPSWATEDADKVGSGWETPSSSTQRPGRGGRSSSRARSQVLFRNQSRSPQSRPNERLSSSTPRSNRWGGNKPPRPHLASPPPPPLSGSGTRKNAVERALESLTAAGADTTRALPAVDGDRQTDNGWNGRANRSWHRDLSAPDFRRSGDRQNHQGGRETQQQGRGDRGWPDEYGDGASPASPRTPPLPE